MTGAAGAEGASVYVTDYAWPDLEIERELLAPIGARLVVAPSAIDGARAILTNWARVGADLLDSATECLLVTRYGVGLDNIDVARATELGMLVTNVPDYCVDEVADHTLALVLAAARRICQFDEQTRNGVWDNQAAGEMRRLSALTLGLIGYGRIARAVATRARAFGMTIATFGSAHAAGAQPAPDQILNDLHELLRTADVVSIHVPLTSSTAGMIGAGELAEMKPTAFLINTARGAVIDHDALAMALSNRSIRGAALDVLPTEPPPREWMERRPANLILTPHAGFFSTESVAELQHRAAMSVRQCLQGEIPPNVVNPEVLESPRLRLGRL